MLVNRSRRYRYLHSRSALLAAFCLSSIAACSSDTSAIADARLVDVPTVEVLADTALDTVAPDSTALDSSRDDADTLAVELPGDLPGDLADDAATELPAPTCQVPAPSEPAVVAVETGVVRGVDLGDSRVFYGIPFAAPPVGDLRFAPPSAAECWEGELARTEFAPHCIQRDPADGVISGQEDCLTLNVWAPSASSQQPRPVLVYIHGGANVIGGAATKLLNLAPLFDGRRLAERNDAVVITLQYRLGPLGFLVLPEMEAVNLGNRDQLAALEWVQRNVAAFGGDPDRVMIFGESAGATNTCALLASPLAAGLFHRALMQSGGCLQPDETDVAAAMSERVDTTACASDQVSDRLACLRGLPPTELLEQLPGTVNVLSAGISTPDLATSYGPVVDGTVLPDSPLATIEAGAHNDVPVVVGANNDELALTLGVTLPSEQAFATHVNVTFAFLSKAKRDDILAAYDLTDYASPTEALVSLYSDLRFICPARRVARALAAASTAPTWRYHFQRKMVGNQGPLPASHGIELAFVFGSLSDLPPLIFIPDPVDVTLSDTMIAMWGAFAAQGDPNEHGITGGSVPSWPQATPTDTADPVLLFDAPIGVDDAGPRRAPCDLWDTILQ